MSRLPPTAPIAPRAFAGVALAICAVTSARAAAAPPAPETPAPAAAPTPPRVDGAYVGVLAWGSAAFARVDALDTPEPFVGPGGALRAGDVVFPWFAVGVALAGKGGFAGSQDPAQRMGWGGILVELGFFPVPRIPFSIRTGFGFGAGAVLRYGSTRRFGFGGALFEGAVRYEWFPLASRKRPRRGGGWAIGPELGWIGHTPAGRGRPMVNTVFAGLWTGFYFGS